MEKNKWLTLLFSSGMLISQAQDTLKIVGMPADTLRALEVLEVADTIHDQPSKTDYEISNASTERPSDKNRSAKQFMIFPSMVTTSISMVAPMGQSGSYSIEDANGRVYYNGWLGPGLVTPILVGRLKSGMYYVRFDGEGFRETRTFMKM